MKKTPFEIGDRIEMVHAASAMGRTLSDNKYGSQVLDFDGIGTVKVSMPIYENRIIPLEVGDDYQMVFFTRAGLYQCKGRVRRRYSEDRMHVMDILFLTDMEKYQRRKFYRLDCMFQIKFRMISDEEEQTEEWKEGMVSDLSGGGMRFHCKTELPQDAKVEIMLPLSLQKGFVPIRFRLKVLSCAYYEGSRTAYEIRGEFEDVKDSEREIVIKYIFEEQRRRLRKE